MCMILAVFIVLLKSEWGEGLNGDSNPDLFDASAVIYQLSNQANWELVIMWVNDKPLDDEYGPAYTMYIFQVFLATN